MSPSKVQTAVQSDRHEHYAVSSGMQQSEYQDYQNRLNTTQHARNSPYERRLNSLHSDARTFDSFIGSRGVSSDEPEKKFKCVS